MGYRIKVKNIILKEVENTKHQLDRFKSRFNVLCQGDIDNEDKMNILRNVNSLNQIDLDNKSYAIKLGSFKVNKNSKYFVDVNGRGYYRVNDELFKDSTGNEFWAIVRNNKITTFMLRKDVQSRDVNYMIEKLRIDDVIFDVSKIEVPELVESEEVITEDLNTQKEMETLALEIFNIYIKELIENKALLLKYKMFPSSWVFNKLDKSKFNKLKDFVTNYALDFAFIKNLSAKGMFKPTNNSTGGIRVVYDLETVIKEVSGLDYNQNIDEQLKDLYYSLRISSVMSTILHELQHAYDYYRSNGKAIFNNKSKKYYDKPHDIKKYVGLKHEIMARATQTFDNIQYNNYSNVTEFVKNFQDNFSGWALIKPDDRKYLQRLAAKRYHEIEDKKKEDITAKDDFDKKVDALKYKNKKEGE